MHVLLNVKIPVIEPAEAAEVETKTVGGCRSEIDRSSARAHRHNFEPRGVQRGGRRNQNKFVKSFRLASRDFQATENRYTSQLQVASYS